MKLITARHEVFGECRVPQSYVEQWPDEWQLIDAAPVVEGPVKPYDPVEHTLNPAEGDDGVLAFLAVASPEERERVKAAERARTDREPRKTVLDWQPSPEE